MIASPTPAKRVAFCLSRDRVLSLVDTAKLPLLHMQALQGADVPMARARDELRGRIIAA